MASLVPSVTQGENLNREFTKVTRCHRFELSSLTDAAAGASRSVFAAVGT